MTSDKIVIATNSSWNIVNFRLGLIRGLQEAGHEVVAVTPPDEHVDELARENIAHYPIEIDTRGTSVVRDLRLLTDYYRLLGQIRPSAFLGYTIKPNVFGSLAAHMRGIPVINNIAGLGEAFLERSWINRVVRLLYKLSVSRSQVVFFQNREDRDLLVQHGIAREATSRLLPGSGIDLGRFVPTAPEPLQEDRGFTFLLVARLLWAKGIGEFVEAARIVRRQVPDARFQLLGLAQQGRGAIDQAKIDGWSREGVVEFLGGARDVRPFVGSADCIVLPTWYREGTPRVLLEAAAMGKPLIATDMPGCREIVADGVNGFLCAPRSVEALADAMLRMLAMSAGARQELGANARQRVEREFDERIVIQRYLEALDGLTVD